MLMSRRKNHHTKKALSALPLRFLCLNALLAVLVVAGCNSKTNKTNQLRSAMIGPWQEYSLTYGKQKYKCPIDIMPFPDQGYSCSTYGFLQFNEDGTAFAQHGQHTQHADKLKPWHLEGDKLIFGDGVTKNQDDPNPPIETHVMVSDDGQTLNVASKYQRGDTMTMEYHKSTTTISDQPKPGSPEDIFK